MIATVKTKQRILYFTGIGITSTLVHLTVVVGLVTCGLAPLIANIIAFLIAFNISFFGHRRLTFAQLQDNKQLQPLPFLLVAITAGILNEYMYYLLLHYTHLNYLVALILVVSLVAVFTFTASKLWACR